MPTLKEEILKELDVLFAFEAEELATKLELICRRHIEEALDTGAGIALDVEHYRTEATKIVEYVKLKSEYLKSKGITE